MKTSPIIGLLLLLNAGCGGDSPTKPLDMGGQDGSQVALLVEELNEAVGNPKKLDATFAKGSKPSDAKKLTRFSYSVVGKPSVSGTTATCTVRIDSTAGEKVAELEWSFEKDGDKWKIKNAPLP